MNRDYPTCSYIEFIKSFEETRLDLPLRNGQTLMNLLHRYWKEEYYRISTNLSDIDCFYDDRLIPKTLKHLENTWSIKK